MLPFKVTKKPQSNHSVPLVIDLDGTLVATDTLIESIIALLRRNLTNIFRILAWLAHSRSHLKQAVSSKTQVDVEHLPYRQDILIFAQDAKNAGREVILATASDQKTARAIAKYLSVFTETFGSDGKRNLSGQRKADFLVETYGKGNFDYIGNSVRDIPVWNVSRYALVVGMPTLLVTIISKSTPFQHRFTKPESFGYSVYRLIRTRHWVKNILIFVPLFAAHQFTNGVAISSTILAFMAVSLAASSVYVINDLVDIPADRRHPVKRNRPLASGAISSTAALPIALLLVLVSLSIATLLPINFVWLLITYLILSFFYSFSLKRIVVADVIILALLYTTRIFLGAAAITVPVSSWLAAFALFIFFSIALVKRFSEIQRVKHEGGTIITGRGYGANDEHPLAMIGISSGMLSVVIFALYVNSRDVAALYVHPQLLWSVVPLLLYWVGRVWLLAFRGKVDEDPLLFAMRDSASIITGGAIIIAALLAI